MLERHSTASAALEIARTVLSGPSETNTGALNEVSAILISIGKCAVGRALQQRRRHEACDETMKKPLMKMFPSLSRMIALGQTRVLCRLAPCPLPGKWTSDRCARLCACRGPTLTGIRQPISAPWAAAASCGCPSATVADSLGFPGGPLGRRVGMVTAFGVGDDKTGRVAAAGDMLGGVAHDERATEPEPVTGALHWRAIRNDATRLPPA